MWSYDVIFVYYTFLTTWKFLKKVFLWVRIFLASRVYIGIHEVMHVDYWFEVPYCQNKATTSLFPFNLNGFNVVSKVWGELGRLSRWSRYPSSPHFLLLVAKVSHKPRWSWKSFMFLTFLFRSPKSHGKRGLTWALNGIFR